MRRVLAAFAAASLFPTLAHAIVVRHDRPDESYLAEPSNFPALASMFTTPAGHRDCVATLIAPQWLITAKHCTMDPALDAAVLNGTFLVTFAAGQKARVNRIVRAQDPDGIELGGDIALLQLSEVVEDIEPYPLYGDGDEIGRNAFIPGWGDTGTGLEGLTESPDGKFRVAENRIDAAEGPFLILRFDDPRSAADKALPSEGISGPGDSGGPALIATPTGLKVAGISSHQRGFGPGEGIYGVDEVYIRVEAFRDWIDATIDGANSE